MSANVGVVLTGTALVLALGGCSVVSGNDDDPESAVGRTVTSVPTRVVSDPFCDTMVELRSQALAGELPDDPDYVINTYLDLVPMVPAAIGADFRQMLVEIDEDVDLADIGVATVPPVGTTPGGSAAGTTLPTDAAAVTVVPGSVVAGVIESEGYAPDETAIGRVQAFVEATCTATANNPGPAATPPS